MEYDAFNYEGTATVKTNTRDVEVYVYAHAFTRGETTTWGGKIIRVPQHLYDEFLKTNTPRLEIGDRSEYIVFSRQKLLDGYVHFEGGRSRPPWWP